MKEILLGKIFTRNSKERISLKHLDQEKPFITLDFEKLDEYLKGKDTCVFISKDSRRASVKGNGFLMDESFLKNFLGQSKKEKLQERVCDYIDQLKKFPRSLLALVKKLIVDEGLRNFLLATLSKSQTLEPWEDFVCSKLERLERREKAVQKIDIQKAIRLIFNEGGLLQELLPDYEYRQEQFMTSLEIAESIERENGVMIEAGTGTGKSIAYLAPTAYACVSQLNQAVISTRTRILQDQLVNKDVPIVRKLPNLSDLRVSALKGRERYLCLQKLAENLQLALNGLTSPLFAREMFGVLLWSMITPQGDVDSLTLEDSTRKSIAGNRFDCTKQACAFYNVCPYYLARDNAARADLIITNHSLLFSEANIRLSDGQTEDTPALGTLLPAFKYLVVDEAHELEASLTQAMSYVLDTAELAASLKKTRESVRNAFGLLKRRFNETFLRKLWDKMNCASGELESLMKDLFAYSGPPNVGEKTVFSKEKLEGLFEILLRASDTLQVHSYVLNQSVQMLEDLSEEGDRGAGELSIPLRRLAGELKETLKQLAGISSSQEARVIYAHRPHREGTILFYSSPVENDKLMGNIFPEVKVKIFISATLWVYSKGSDGFNYSRRILGTGKDFASVRLGTSFDYTQQLKFFVAEDMPDYFPDSAAYMEKASKIIEGALKVTGGGSMVLFTSYGDMGAAVNSLTSKLPELTINTQERNGSPATVLAEHTNSASSVIFGTRAFWEGVDLPGEQLKLLILYKLPFERPDEPLIEARIKRYGTRSFLEGMNKYYYPKMITAFRQGIGRLIRTRKDRGVVLVLDRRVIDPGRTYSRKLLASLPPGLRVESLKSGQILTQLRKLKREKWF